MKATELRMFNLFYPIDRTNNVHLPIKSAFKVLAIGFKIEAIPYNKVPAQVEKWSEFDSRDIEPIPLTEEWLFKFGFDKPAYSICGDIFHLTKWDKNPLDWCVAMNKNNAIIVEKLQYVHQLQNLYFALTGEELTIKE